MDYRDLRRRYPRMPGESQEKYNARLEYEWEVISEDAARLLRQRLMDSHQTTQGANTSFAGGSTIDGRDWSPEPDDDEYTDPLNSSCDDPSEVSYENYYEEISQARYDLLGVDRSIYLVYLKSEEWDKKRRHKLQQAEYRCQRCGSKTNLEVHHFTYDRIYQERDSDLTVLCSDCHRRTHRTRL